jgi:glyoxylase I family protein
LAGGAANDSPPFEPLGLDHLLLVVRGMEEAERFYCDVLGCTVLNKMPANAMLELSAGITLVDVADPKGAWAGSNGTGSNVDHFAIVTSWWDEAAMRSHLAHHRVAIEEERAEADTLSFYVRDPSGNMVELVRKGTAEA